MGYRNEFEALQHRLEVVKSERDGLRDEVEALRQARDDAEGKTRREAYLRKELNKLRGMPEKLANSEIRSRQLEARVRELRAEEPPAKRAEAMQTSTDGMRMALLGIGVLLLLVLAARMALGT